MRAYVQLVILAIVCIAPASASRTLSQSLHKPGYDSVDSIFRGHYNWLVTIGRCDCADRPAGLQLAYQLACLLPLQWALFPLQSARASSPDRRECT